MRISKKSKLSNPLKENKDENDREVKLREQRWSDVTMTLSRLASPRHTTKTHNQHSYKVTLQYSYDLEIKVMGRGNVRGKLKGKGFVFFLSLFPFLFCLFSFDHLSHYTTFAASLHWSTIHEQIPRFEHERGSAKEPIYIQSFWIVWRQEENSRAFPVYLPPLSSNKLQMKGSEPLQSNNNNKFLVC